MCRAVKCGTCGKMTWAGCGQHIESVRAARRGVLSVRRCATSFRTLPLGMPLPLRARAPRRATRREAARGAHLRAAAAAARTTRRRRRAHDSVRNEEMC
jgi:hypothetical protein